MVEYVKVKDSKETKTRKPQKLQVGTVGSGVILFVMLLVFYWLLWLCLDLLHHLCKFLIDNTNLSILVIAAASVHISFIIITNGK
jgi:hypothetical protein